jgi:hypothetical protein
MRLSTLLTPGALHPPQGDLASIRLDRNAAGVDLSGSPQRLLNFALDLDRWNLRPDLNVIRV